MAKLSPYVRFNDGKCREAMTFYKSCFGGKLEFMTVGEVPADMKEEMEKDGAKLSKEVDDLFDKMSKGGEVFMKPEKMFWGGYFGTLTDKYGVEWSFHFQMEPMKK